MLGACSSLVGFLMDRLALLPFVDQLSRHLGWLGRLYSAVSLILSIRENVVIPVTLNSTTPHPSIPPEYELLIWGNLPW